MIAVAVKETNEVLGFPDGTSVDEMEHAIAGDRNGTISEYKPSFYDRTFKPVFDTLKMTSNMSIFQPRFITREVEPTREKAFITSAARAATADIFKPPFSEKEAAAYPGAALAGSLVGTLAGMKGIGALLSATRLPAFAGWAGKVLSQSGKAGEVAAKVVPAAITQGAVGGAYRGVEQTVNEIREEEYPDLAKIGKAVLHDTLWWGGIGGAVAPLSKAAGVAVSAGLGYTMAKADGQSEPDALLNGGILAGFHLLSAHGKQPEVRQAVVNHIEKTLADYQKAKNPMIDDNIVIRAAQEKVMLEAEKVAGPEFVGQKAVAEVLKTPEATQKLVENIASDVLDVKPNGGKPGENTGISINETKVTGNKISLKDHLEGQKKDLIKQGFSPEEANKLVDQSPGAINYSETKKDLLNLINWEAYQQSGERWRFTNDEGQQQYSGSPTAHSAAMSEIGVKESFRLLNKAYNDEPLTPGQKEKVNLLLSDYRVNLKKEIEATIQEEKNVEPRLPETPSADEIRQAVEKESQVAEYDWDGNIVQKENSAKVTPPDLSSSIFPKPKIEEGTNLSSESGKVVLPSVKETVKESIYQKVFNRFQSIENTVEKAKKLGAVIKPGEDAGISADRYLSIGNQAESVLNNGPYRINKKGNIENNGEGLRPVIRDFDAKVKSLEKNTDVRNQDLDNYLIARRIIEDLQRPKSESNAEFIVSPEQVAEAQKVIKEINDKYGDNVKTFEETAARIYDYQKRVLQSLVESGNLSQEQYDSILSKNPNYIPFDRVIPTEETPTGTPVSKNRFNGARAPVKRIKGSSLEIHDPIESVIKNTYRIMDAASRNKVFKDVYSLKDIPELGIEAISPDMRPIKLTAGEAGGEEGTIFRPSQFKPKGNVVEGYIDGKRKYMEVSKNLYEAMTGLNETSSSLMVKILSKPASWLRAGATLTPEFILRNPIRDQWTALLQTSVGFKPFLDTCGAIADIMGKSKVYEQWIRSGGSYAGFVELSRPALSKMVDTLRGDKQLLKKLNIVTQMGYSSQLMEQSTRLGVYKASLKKGMSAVEAARESRESTLNFSRRGSATRDINATIAFFNAGLQSLDKSVRTIKKDPLGFSMKAVATITIPSVLLYLKNRQEPDYKELPRWQKDLFWMFKINDVWYRVPKPFSYGQIFGSLPERFLEYLDTKNPDAFNGGDIAKSLYDSLSPISGDPMSGILPTAIKPLIENQFNWSAFRGRAIVPEWKTNLIPSEQYSRSDTETSKALGIIFNVSPSKVENLINGWLGGSGRYALQGGDQIIGAIKKASGDKVKQQKPAELADIPLLKGFIARTPTGFNSESVKSFYSEKKRIVGLSNTYNGFIKSGEMGRAKILKEKNPELSLSKELNKYGRQISDISKRSEMVVNSNLPEAEKRDQLKKHDEEIVDIANRANKKILGIKGK